MIPGRERVAVIGGGVAGIVSAQILQQRYEVTLLEKSNYLGGHTNTILIPDGPDAGTPVDTGFIVYNDRTYPLFRRFLAQLGVEGRPSDMSFSYFDEESRFQYAGSDLNGLFAQRANLVRPDFWAMLYGIFRFSGQALSDLQEGRLDRSLTLRRYLERLKLPRAFTDLYLFPMTAAIWSMPAAECFEFPAATFVRFFANHGLLALKDRPQWYTVRGGSHTYVKRFAERFTGEIRLSARIEHLRREGAGPVIRYEGGREERFDRVVVATHADQGLRLLADPSPAEQRLLGAWRYSRNRTVLHTDAAVLPPLRRARASWNYTREAGAGPGAPVSLTYHMNRLQGLATREQYCVTLNRTRPIPRERIIREIEYHHPVYDLSALASQRELAGLNGRRSTWFAGSYFGCGFHEDAVRSAVSVAQSMGLELEGVSPWQERSSAPGSISAT